MPETPSFDPKIRTAGPSDREIIRSLIDDHEFYHRHLDWFSPQEWLGEQPYLILENTGGDAAALACPPCPPGIGWIRLFVTNKNVQIRNAWTALLDSTVQRSTSSGIEILCGLGFAIWFRELLENSGFYHLQDVVGLSIRITEKNCFQSSIHVDIREATPNDIPQIAAVDERSFDRMWQQPLVTMQPAIEQAGYVSVAISGGEIVGYQLSTTSPNSAHLARLAVEPRFQNQQIGRSLITDLIKQCKYQGIEDLTVNTQSDNQASLALYKRMGFEFTGERYPVYTLHLH